MVEALLKDFDDDVQIFDRQLKEFRDFVGSSKKRAEVSELRAAEAARGRERLQGARKTAAREILTRIEGKNLPEVIRHILTRPWANVLVLTILRQGEGSHPWKTSLRVADELVWAAHPKQTDSERARLRALVPELEKALRQGLAMVAYHDNDVRDLLSDLGRFYESQLNPTAAPPADESPAPAAEEAAVAASSEGAEDTPGLEVEVKTPATRTLRSSPRRARLQRRLPRTISSTNWLGNPGSQRRKSIQSRKSATNITRLRVPSRLEPGSSFVMTKAAQSGPSCPGSARSAASTCSSTARASRSPTRRSGHSPVNSAMGEP